MPRGERYTRVPHYVLEALVRARLSSTALQLCLWIARNTWGWNKRWTPPTSGRALAKAVKVDVKSCWLALRVLEAQKLVERDAHGRFRLNPDEAIWKALGADPTEASAGAQGVGVGQQPGSEGVGVRQHSGVGVDQHPESEGVGVGQQGVGVGQQGVGVGQHPSYARVKRQSLTVETVSDSRDSTSGTEKELGAGPGKVKPTIEPTSGKTAAAEQQELEDLDPVVHWYPVKGKGDRAPAAPGQPPPPGSYWPLRKSKVEEYREAFPAVDVDQQLRNLLIWCRDNPIRRKTYGGMPRFLSGRLAWKQDHPGWRRPAAAPIPPAAEAQKAESMRRAADRLANFE